MKQILSVKDVAHLLDFSEEHVRRMIRNGEIRAAGGQTHGQAYMISRRALAGFWKGRGGAPKDLFEGHAISGSEEPSPDQSL